MSRRLGIALVVLSSVAFGTMAPFARLAYAHGTNPTTLLFLRFGSAGLVMVAICRLRGVPMPRGKTLLGLALMGGLGYVGQSLAFFTALTMANAGLVALLLYLHPAIVAVLSAFVLREPLTRLRGGAVLLALVGTAFTVGPSLDARPLGIVLGTASAVIYSGYIMAGTKLLKNVAPLAGSAVIMTCAGAVFGVVAAADRFALPSSVAGWVGVAGVALFGTVFAVTAFLIGLAAIGPTTASVLSTFEPLTTVLLAALVLGEAIDLWTAVGGACILTAAIVLARTPARRVHRSAGTE